MSGTRLPVVVPVWALMFGAGFGWFLPRLLLRAEAAKARADFRHALGAYLDVLVLLLAAQEGPESAMDLAAQAGQGPAFAELRRAVWQARLAGEPVWDTLDVLGRRLRITELREVAAAGSLAGESGAAVRQSLTAKARSLRQTALAEAETVARKKSQALFGPLVLMGLGFVIFLIYPMLTNLSFGG
jgi:Flp pilus assembly protein TadB